MKHFVTILITFLFQLSCGKTDEKSLPEPKYQFTNGSEVNLSNRFNDDQLGILNRAFRSIDTLSFEGHAVESDVTDLLQIPSTSASHLSDWLVMRAKHFVSNKFTDGDYPVRVVDRNTRVIHSANLTGLDQFDDSSAFNLGAFFYRYALTEKTKLVGAKDIYFQIKVNRQWVDITSPRSGLVLLNPEIFNFGELSENGNLSIIATLFHEARHSDGNQHSNSLAFSHIKCPEYLELYSGRYACDNVANGAYAVEAKITKLYTDKACEQDCDERYRAIANAQYLDAKSRIITEDDELPFLDASPATEIMTIESRRLK